MFKRVVTSEKELRDLMGTPSERAIKKESAVIDEPSREFIAHSPFLLLATSDTNGRCDVSPKGDAPGFVRVLDERHLVIPDRPGNKRLDGLRNLLANPHVGMIFLIPGREETLRVNGRATIVRDEDVLESLDWVVASVHSSFRMASDAMTERMIRALEHPLVDMLGHPSGRKIEQREPYAFDAEAVICISNKKLTWQVVHGLERRGIPAYGPIWDS